MKAKKISTDNLFRAATFALAAVPLTAIAPLPKWVSLLILTSIAGVTLWALLRLMDEVQQLERSIYRPREEGRSRDMKERILHGKGIW